MNLIVPSNEGINRHGSFFENHPINISRVLTLSKLKDSTRSKSQIDKIEFVFAYNVIIRWHYESEADRDKEYDRIINKFKINI